MSGLRSCILLSLTFAGILLSCAGPSKSAKTEPQEPSAMKVQATTSDKSLVAPDIVQCTGMHIDGTIKNVTMSNSNGDYYLSCNIKAQGCETPVPGKNYLLFNKNTHWKMPGATDYVDLSFIQDWTVTYNQAENVGLVPQDSTTHGALGIYMLDSWNAVPHHP